MTEVPAGRTPEELRRALAEADDVTAQALRTRPGELVVDLVRISSRSTWTASPSKTPNSA